MLLAPHWKKNHRLSEVLGSPETNSSVGFGNSFPIEHICQRIANTSVPEGIDYCLEQLADDIG